MSCGDCHNHNRQDLIQDLKPSDETLKQGRNRDNGMLDLTLTPQISLFVSCFLLLLYAEP